MTQLATVGEEGSGTRRARGRTHADATFPVVDKSYPLPADYAATLGELKNRISTERLRVVLAANQTMVLLYWDIGKLILDRQAASGWGARVIDRLSSDLREAFPEMQGLSARNLKYMRLFADSWPDRAIVQRTVAQLPWRHNIALLEKLKDLDARLWYAEQSIQNGWSRDVLDLHIQRRTYSRTGKAATNFARTLPAQDSDLTSEVFKDPYLFDFLGTTDPRREREVENALVEHIQQFLVELGSGFAFVGRQVHLEFSDQDFYLDLLFYHLKLRRFVVVELKAIPFDPAFVGTLNVYLSAVDDLLRHRDDAPSIGLLLCRSKNKTVVEYALRDLNKPIGVADWQTQLVDSLPREFEGSLPTVKEIESEISRFESAPDRASG